MKLGELLSELDLLLPNPYSDDEKVVFMNKTIREIKRFAGTNDVFCLDANSLALYPLPEEISGEDILFVSINGREYLPKNISEDGDVFYSLIPTGFITLEPSPELGEKIEIVYSTVELFRRLDACDNDDAFLAQSTSLDEEHRSMLLYGAMADIALATEDAVMSNNLRSEFNALKVAAMQGKYKKRGKYPKTKIVM